MNEPDLRRIEKFIYKADRDTIELLLYTIMKDWSYEKAITLSSATVVHNEISELEELKYGKIFEGIDNRGLRLVKESGHTVLNDKIDALKKDLKRYHRRYNNACDREQ